MKRGFNVLCLSLATAFWGLSIVSQAVGNRYMQPFTFNAVRFVISVAALVPALIVFRSLRGFAAQKHDLLKGGSLCGAALFFCINLQQAALQCPWSSISQARTARLRCGWPSRSPAPACGCSAPRGACRCRLAKGFV